MPSKRLRRPRLIALVATVALLALAAACSDDDPSAGTLYVGGIPDQNLTSLDRQFGLLTSYLERATGLDVEFVPSIDYAAIVTAFDRGDVQLAWFGGLTGVQARIAEPDAQAILQRPRDADFHSVFIARCDLDIRRLADLPGLTFTFGSPSSTSGHLMPRHFLIEEGIDPDADFNGPPNFSGSHDKTYALVGAGAFQAGALSEAVWQDAVESGSVDTGEVCEVMTSEPYYDYNWTIRGDVDDKLGDGATQAITDALRALSADLGDEEAELLDLFQTDGFIATNNDNYSAIEDIARGIGIIE